MPASEPRPESLRRKLLAIASTVLEGDIDPALTVEVVFRATDGSQEHVFRFLAREMRVGVGEDLNDLEREILEAATHTPQTAKKLAGILRREPRTYFWDCLRALVRRGLLLQGPDGYRLSG